MKSKADVTAEKLRGGFYTPPPLVHFCLNRLLPLLPGESQLRLLEPSAGDGAFIRGIGGHTDLARRVEEITAVEPLDIEAEKCRRQLSLSSLSGNVLAESAVDWALGAKEAFDGAVGNPPFVRYQFISANDRAAIPKLAADAEISFAGVSNLWIPVLTAALSRLRHAGGFAFVVPSELLTGFSAARLRRWLAANFIDLRIDLFSPGSFPGVLQEVVVLSGRRGTTMARRAFITITEHGLSGAEISWQHHVDPDEQNWTRYLLAPAQLHALRAAQADKSVRALGNLARFQVSVVTGANGFFTVSDSVLEEHNLGQWGKPLLPRIRHAGGLIYGARDHEATRSDQARSWLLDFAAEADDPKSHSLSAAYIREGEAQGLHERYKCRIRKPWYRVPHIVRGSLMLSKRSHRMPRVICNQASAYTTDTIYRGEPVPGALPSQAIAACFHGSLTLLTAELEGRSFGGGVLELVPSEIARLAVATVPGAESWLRELDAILRRDGEEALVAETDKRHLAAGSIEPEILEAIAAARWELMKRRLDRNEREQPSVELPEAA